MLTTRLWMGSVLIVLVVAMLTLDQELRGYPFQLAFQLCLALLGTRELTALLAARTIHRWIALAGIVGLTLVPWVVGYGRFTASEIATEEPATWANLWTENAPIWVTLLALAVALHLAIYLAEMATFREPGVSFERMARTWWVVAYLGLLPSFFALIRWEFPWRSSLGTVALALAIFVPKGCDIGAYFTGRALGRHPMTPTLSPKKTWEGAIGGLIFAAVVAVGIDRWAPASPLRRNLGIEIAFGLTGGAAGMLGDLAESLIKRDCQTKDASHVVPGFGGVLDVVDAVIFAAPVAYVWFAAIV